MAKRAFLAAAIASAAVTVDGPARPAFAAAAAPFPPPDLREIKLENGLTLLLLPDATTPVFTIMLWVPAGARTEPPGLSGISHYLEHAYSLGSKRLAPREIDRIVQEQGGQKNAFTSHDATAYYESLPKASLARIIELEADRLGSLTLPEERLRSELDVVREERRWRYENSPTGLMTETLLATAFARHPYRNPVIGWPEDLARLRRQDLLSYYRAHYVPSNVAYVLVGDFDADEAVLLFRRHFGPLPAGARPATAPEPEPEQKEERRARLERASVKLPRLGMLWKVPGLDHADTPALEVLETALLDGDAARLERVLKRERMLASSVGGGHWQLRDPGAFTLSAEALPGVAIEALERACDEALEAVARGGLDGSELERAKNQIELAFVTGLESTAARARSLGRFHTLSARGVAYLRDFPDRIRAVSGDDIRRVVTTYLRKEHRTVVHLLPASASKGPSGEPAAASRPALGASWESFGDARCATLPNGARVLYQRADRLPAVSIALMVRAGSGADPAGREGLATLTLELLKAGTAKLDEEAVASRFGALGASLSSARGVDSVSLGTTVMERDFEEALGLLAEVALRPAFPADRLERVRRELLAEKESAASSADTLLVEAFYASAYAGTSYAHPLNGTPESLRALAREDVLAFHAGGYRAENMTLAIVGNVAAERVEVALARELAGVTSGAKIRSPRPFSVEPGRGAPRVTIVDKADQTQTHIRLGGPALARGDPDFDALVIAHTVLGGSGLASRLADVVRTRHGLAYSTGTNLVARELKGPLVAGAQTRNDAAGRAIDLMLAEIERIRTEAIPPEELERAKAQVAGSLPFKLETLAQKAGALLEAELYGLGPDHLRRQIERIRALSAEDVLAAARRHVDPGKMTIALVGPRAVLEQELAARRASAEGAEGADGAEKKGER